MWERDFEGKKENKKLKGKSGGSKSAGLKTVP